MDSEKVTSKGRCEIRWRIKPCVYWPEKCPRPREKQVQSLWSIKMFGLFEKVQVASLIRQVGILVGQCGSRDKSTEGRAGIWLLL